MERTARARWRFTLAALGLVLLVLGGSDLAEWGGQGAPRSVALAQLAKGEPPARWLRIEGGQVDLEGAISTSGTVELEALLAPLRPPGASPGPIAVLVQTREPRALELFGQLHLGLDSEAERAAFRKANAAELRPEKPVTGMVLGGLTARANRASLTQLAKEAGFEVAPEVVFLIAGKEPQPARGAAFAILGLLGLLKVLWPRRGRQTADGARG